MARGTLLVAAVLVGGTSVSACSNPIVGKWRNSDCLPPETLDLQSDESGSATNFVCSVDVVGGTCSGVPSCSLKWNDKGDLTYDLTMSCCTGGRSASCKVDGDSMRCTYAGTSGSVAYSRVDE
jgi:hypothetical protein